LILPLFELSARLIRGCYDHHLYHYYNSSMPTDSLDEIFDLTLHEACIKSNHRCHSIITIVVFVFKQEDISMGDVCANVDVHHTRYAVGHLLSWSF